jgi:hypothetical protein
MMGSRTKILLTLALLAAGLALEAQIQEAVRTPPAAAHLEVPDDPPAGVDRSSMARSPAAVVHRGGFTSVQVNVDSLGQNIVGDAANETTIAVDPTDPSRLVVGWRQFDSVASNFRQAGWAYSHDGGATWTFPGSIDAGNFRSDPVVGVDSTGVFYYYSVRVPSGSFINDMYRSTDGGVTWGAPAFACGGDKAWFTIDRTGGLGHGHAYAFWTSVFSCPGASGHFNRSTDGGLNWDPEVDVPGALRWGTLDVGPNGELYVVGTGNTGLSVARSSNAQDSGREVVFDAEHPVDLGGPLSSSQGPNPGGLLGQAWIAVDPGTGALYALASVDPAGADPLDVHFVRSIDGGDTWSTPVRINDDDAGAWQWFGTLSVAPGGRLDAIWNDTRNAGGGLASELAYAYSTDGGVTWSANQLLTPPWDPLVGHPQQNKIGDYYHMVSFDDAAHLAYAATFNGEQDAYYLRIPANRLFADGFESGDTSAWSITVP